MSKEAEIVGILDSAFLPVCDLAQATEERTARKIFPVWSSLVKQRVLQSRQK